MAMEKIANPSKQLHKHAAPVALLLTGVITLAVVAITNYTSQGLATETTLVRALFTRVLDVKPSTNGLASVSRHQEKPAGTSNLEQVGQSAQLSLSLAESKN
jgi:hypothetical protein